ncbi:MAG: glycosyltransferase family 4 protein [Spirochaetales bacterium]|nr:glycosyltransferase family 4 protein [Spirochaetales bacterium]
MGDGCRLAIVSGKLGDVDGVSLETDKWIRVLGEQGHEVYTISGKYSSVLTSVPQERQLTVDAIRFDSDRQRHYEHQVFPYLNSTRPLLLNSDQQNEVVEELESLGADVANHLFDIIKENSIDAIIAENTNAMPMTLLGGIAVHLLATEMRVATIFHHHDFWWERSRFSRNSISDLLNRIMPPSDLALEHVVISSYAAHILSSIKRVSPFVIPNCEDFDSPPVPDEYNQSLRSELGFRDDDILVVQPTRIVPRKRIEDSVSLLGKLIARYPEFRDRIQYIISLYQGDEPNENYIEQIQEQAESLGLPLHFVSDRVASVRGVDAAGRRLFTNRDVLVNADLVTYLPIWEGFGNALLEALAARAPVVATTYLVYKTDIMPSGIKNIEIRDRYDDAGSLVIPDTALESIHYLLTHPEYRRDLVERNFQIAKNEFSLDVLRERLNKVLSVYGDEMRASRQRLAKSKLNYSV